MAVHGLGDDYLRDISFDVRAGEVLGVSGLMGAGRTELARLLFGLRKPRSGSITLDGKPLTVRNPVQAIDAGLGFVTEDRKGQGLVLDLSLRENVSLAHIPSRLGVIDRGRERKQARELIEQLHIRTRDMELDVRALSGGNQQKVVMGRALANDPKLLVLIQPTAGVDVRSKETLLGVVDRVRDGGTGVLVASDELDDLRTCDRVLVLFQGRQVAEFGSDWSDHDLVAAMEGLDLDDE